MDADRIQVANETPRAPVVRMRLACARHCKMVNVGATIPKVRVIVEVAMIIAVHLSWFALAVKYSKAECYEVDTIGHQNGHRKEPPTPTRVSTTSPSTISTLYAAGPVWGSTGASETTVAASMPSYQMQIG